MLTLNIESPANRLVRVLELIDAEQYIESHDLISIIKESDELHPLIESYLHDANHSHKAFKYRGETQGRPLRSDIDTKLDRFTAIGLVMLEREKAGGNLSKTAAIKLAAKKSRPGYGLTRLKALLKGFSF